MSKNVGLFPGSKYIFAIGLILIQLLGIKILVNTDKFTKWPRSIWSSKKIHLDCNSNNAKV